MSNTRRDILKTAGVSVAAICGLNKSVQAEAGPGQRQFYVRNFGAAGDGQSVDTQSIQSAIEAASLSGGGTVIFAAGNFICGSISLRSNVYLYLDGGATLTAAKRFDFFEQNAVINGQNLENVGVLGIGTIEGSGFELAKQQRIGSKGTLVLNFEDCRNITIKDITLKNSYQWMQHYVGCENINIDGIKVHTKVRDCNDGLDIDSCRKVRVSNCEINSGDDCIVLKSSIDRPCRDVVVTNCVLSSNCTALKTGTDSYGGFENIVFSNCTIYDNLSAAIAINTVDGGRSSNIIVSNINISNARAAISIRLGSRNTVWKKGLPQLDTGSLSNITISNINATGIWGFPISVCGINGHNIENVTFDNIRLRVAGGGTSDMREMAAVMAKEFAVRGSANAKVFEKTALEHTGEVPQVEQSYPDDKMFGPLPAYGLYCRNVKNISLNRLDFGFEKEDERPAVLCDNVSNVDIVNARLMGSKSQSGIMRFINVHSAMVSGSYGSKDAAAFITMAKSSDIVVMNNDLKYVKKIITNDDQSDCYIANNRTYNEKDDSKGQDNA